MNNSGIFQDIYESMTVSKSRAYPRNRHQILVGLSNVYVNVKSQNRIVTLSYQITHLLPFIIPSLKKQTKSPPDLRLRSPQLILHDLHYSQHCLDHRTATIKPPNESKHSLIPNLMANVKCQPPKKKNYFPMSDRELYPKRLTMPDIISQRVFFRQTHDRRIVKLIGNYLRTSTQPF